jgi:pimeloyl-ACP methyl ester carboxylesterase
MPASGAVLEDEEPWLELAPTLLLPDTWLLAAALELPPAPEDDEEEEDDEDDPAPPDVHARNGRVANTVTTLRRMRSPDGLVSQIGSGSAVDAQLPRRGPLLLVGLALLLGTGCSAVGARLYELNNSIQRRNAGMEEKVLHAGDVDIAYAEGGKGDPVVMVHGFSGDKSTWYPMARYLVDGHRVLALDLPPFGDSTRTPAPSCTIDAHVEHLHAFVEALGLERFHLVGNSMGGHTAALYAARHPERVRTLALFDAAGVEMPVESPAVAELKAGRNFFAVRTEEDVDRFMGFVFVDRPTLPGPVKSHMAERGRARADDIQRWLGEYLAAPVPMEPLLGSITAPTLVLWGDGDRILDVSSAGVFQKGIPNASLVLMKHCGHVPMMERPEETATHYVAFLKQQP